MSITENNKVAYRVMLHGSVMLDNVSKNVAEAFIATLTANTQSEIELVPVTQLGEQVLFG